MIHDTTYGVATHTGTSGKFTGDATNRPGIIDSQYDNKPADAAADWSPWPTLSSTTAPTDTDGDGMPDTWENAHGLNPNDASDGNTVGSDGYTNLENYLNGIVTNITNDELRRGTVMGTDEEAGKLPSQPISTNCRRPQTARTRHRNTLSTMDLASPTPKAKVTPLDPTTASNIPAARNTLSLSRPISPSRQ